MTWSDLQKSVPQVHNVGIMSMFFSPPIHSHPSLPFFPKVRNFGLGHVCGLSVHLYSRETCSAWLPPAHSPSLTPPGSGTGRLPVSFGSLRKPWQTLDSAQSSSGGKTMMTSHKGFPPSCHLLHLLGSLSWDHLGPLCLSLTMHASRFC